MRTWLQRYGHILGAVVVLSAFLVALIPAGLGSNDAWGILQSTNALANEGRLAVSRPPGHPTTEFLLYPAIAKVLSVFGLPFDSFPYLVLLWLAAAAAIVLFLLILDTLRVPRREAVLAAAVLALMPPFLSQAIGGEETPIALALVLGAWLLLIKGDGNEITPVPTRRMVVAGLLLGVAVGARPEIGVMALPMAVFLLLRGVTIVRIALAFCVPIGGAVALLWIPVIAAHSQLSPLELATPLRMRILGGGYKHLFQVLPFPASLAFWGAFFVALWRRRVDDLPAQRFVRAAWMVPLIFAGLFFAYPTKPAFCIPGLAFVPIVLALKQCRRSLVAVVALLVIALAVRVDVFHDRVLGAPHLEDGVVQLILRDKPGFKTGAIRRAMTFAAEPRTVVVVEPVETEMDWMVASRIVPLRRSDLVAGGHVQAAYASEQMGSSVLVPRNSLDEPRWVRGVVEQGYRLLLDARVYRNMFTPYAVDHQAQPGDHVSMNLEGGPAECTLY